MKCLPIAARPLASALGLAPWLLDAAARDRVVLLAASEVRGPAVVLGRSQRAGRVLDLDACAARDTAVLRRHTSGNAAYVGAGRALHFALALPHAAALAPDARAANLLNRNLRGFLQGFAHAGALAQYTGRDWIAVQHRPAALVGFDVALDGGVLIELLAGFDASIALPVELATPLERATARWRGRVPIALGEATSRDALAFAERVVAGVCARYDQPRDALEAPSLPYADAVLDARDPVAPGLALGEPVACPVGYCEAAYSASGGAWLGGDVLAPRAWLDAAARALFDGGPVPYHDAVPLEGARVEDLVEAFERARRAG